MAELEVEMAAAVGTTTPTGRPARSGSVLHDAGLSIGQATAAAPGHEPVRTP